MRFLIFMVTAALLLVLNGCSSPVGSYQSFQLSDKVLQSDLAKRAFQYRGPDRNPVVVIHGLLGARLADAEGRSVWGRFGASAPTAETLRNLAHPMEKSRPLPELTGNVYPVSILDRADIRVLGMEFTLPGYDAALSRLYDAGYREEGDLTAAEEVPSLFVFAYDWRRDIPENAARLERFLKDKQNMLKTRYEEHYGIVDADIRFDLLAHSMGGLVGRYFLMYGGQPLPADERLLPVPDWRGGKLVEKLLVVGTPNDGYLDTFVELVNGLVLAPGAAPYPAAILATFPSYYQMLPGFNGGRVFYEDDAARKPLNLFNSAVWLKHQWGLADPANDVYWKLLMPEVRTPGERHQVAVEHLEKCLARARQFRRAMAVVSPKPDSIELYLFAGDAIDTPAEVAVDPENGRVRTAGFEPGDGKIPVASARFDRKPDTAWMQPFSESPVPWRGVNHIRAAHMGFFASPDFWSNAHYMLLMQPTEQQRKRIAERRLQEK